MTYAPPTPGVIPMVSPFSLYGVLGLTSLTPTSGTYEGTDRAVYTPVVIPATCVARRLWWANGSTVSASYNVDCGIYADAGRKPGTKLISSGSTAQGTASQVQFVDVTDTTLHPGLYWLALTCSSTNATFFRSSFTALSQTARFQQASALPLPATATPADGTDNYIYLFGFATTASP